MATQRSEFAVPVAGLAAALLARAEVGPRCQVIAKLVAQLLPGAAVVVYIIEDQGNPSWTAKAIAGEVSVAAGMEFDTGTLGTLAETREFAQFKASAVAREDYAHLDIRRTVNSLAYMPLVVGRLCSARSNSSATRRHFPKN